MMLAQASIPFQKKKSEIMICDYSIEAPLKL